MVTAGAWISGDMEANDREVDAAVDLAKTYRYVDRVIVGNEALAARLPASVNLWDHAIIQETGLTKAQCPRRKE